MRKPNSAFAAGLVLCIASASPAVAEDFPDMVGVLGDPRHFEARGEPLQEPRTAAFDITITIMRQEGRYVWGTISGGGATEPWLGSLWSDGSGYRAVDSDGHVDGRILSEDRIENCYTHTGETMVVSCSILTRQ
jgi:hypothetical protein